MQSNEAAHHPDAEPLRGITAADVAEALEKLEGHHGVKAVWQHDFDGAWRFEGELTVLLNVISSLVAERSTSDEHTAEAKDADDDTLTVREIVDALSTYDPNAEVSFGHDRFGDKHFEINDVNVYDVYRNEIIRREQLDPYSQSELDGR